MKVRTWILAGTLTLWSGVADADRFSDHWHDGKAEMDGYDVVVSRYGADRSGTAVLIYVTEPFSEAKRVKVDDHRSNPTDVVDALKLNLVLDFQTGIYDYNTMTSVFSRTSDFSPLKVSFSSAEWCGHVFSTLVVRDRITGSIDSYFEDESGAVDLPLPDHAVLEDNLLIVLRGLRGPYLEAGKKKTVKLLPTSLRSRLSHQPQQWVSAEISRDAGTTTVNVPAGSFSAVRYRVTVGSATSEYLVEAEWPHRIVQWNSPGLTARMTGSARLAYWQLNGPDGEKYLERVGLTLPGSGR